MIIIQVIIGIILCVLLCVDAEQKYKRNREMSDRLMDTACAYGYMQCKAGVTEIEAVAELRRCRDEARGRKGDQCHQPNLTL